MLLPREFVRYLSRQLVDRLNPQTIETTDPAAAADTVHQLILEELEVEDRLNDEVREILGQYQEYMRREGVSYQEMFRKIKNTLIQQRKVVRASGRDTGDSTKLSRDKINDISHKLVTTLKKSRQLRVKKEGNEVRLSIVRELNDLLQLEDKADRAARQKIRSQQREIIEGTEEYGVLFKRYYAEEFKKLGVDLPS